MSPVIAKFYEFLVEHGAAYPELEDAIDGYVATFSNDDQESVRLALKISNIIVTSAWKAFKKDKGESVMSGKELATHLIEGSEVNYELGFENMGEYRAMLKDRRDKGIIPGYAYDKIMKEIEDLKDSDPYDASTVRDGTGPHGRGMGPGGGRADGSGKNESCDLPVGNKELATQLIEGKLSDLTGLSAGPDPKFSDDGKMTYIGKGTPMTPEEREVNKKFNAACPKCGGWTSMGGMSQYRDTADGCNCRTESCDLRCPNCGDNLGKDTENSKKAFCGNCGHSFPNPAGDDDDE